MLTPKKNYSLYVTCCLFIAGKTTPGCELFDGMESSQYISSSEIKINDANAKVESLRQTTVNPLTSYVSNLTIQYIPKVGKPIEKVELASTENIQTYKVWFYNTDGSVIRRDVSENLFFLFFFLVF